MKDITQALINHLLASAEITALVGQSVFSDRQPQDVAAPCILLWVSTEDAWNHLEGQVGVDQATVRVDAYGKERADANRIAWTVKEYLAGFLYGTMGDVLVRELVRESGIDHGTDRPLEGGGAYRYIATQDFSVTYDSQE